MQKAYPDWKIFSAHKRGDDLIRRSDQVDEMLNPDFPSFIGYISQKTAYST
jgi:hypothetical protein